MTTTPSPPNDDDGLATIRELHTAFIACLVARMENDPTAAELAVVRQFLKDNGLFIKGQHQQSKSGALNYNQEGSIDDSSSRLTDEESNIIYMQELLESLPYKDTETN